MAEGVQWDDAVFDAEETKAAAERAYPFAEKSTESRDRQTRFYPDCIPCWCSVARS